MGGSNSGTSSGRRPVERSAATLLLERNVEDDVGDRFGTKADATEILVVSAERSVMDVVDDWRASRGTLPATFGLITFGEFGRSAARETTADGPSRQSLPGRDVTVTAMSDPGNLRRLGTAATLYLDDWADSDRETVVYVDALDPFIEANGVESTFQFLHLLVQTVTQLGATLAVRADPSRIDERTINTLQPLFDAVTDPGPADGGTTPPALDTDTIHELLRNPRRRFVLRSLFQDESVGLATLAERLARRESSSEPPTDDDQRRAFTALASVHVPRLAEAGQSCSTVPTSGSLSRTPHAVPSASKDT
ncbi:hypothetical protein ACFQL0_05735 [Haloplanus litoreus]|uniref:DUF7504 family protein n=1 Tax=Haloplanus litoreus TaxID=767515 RepID=UPI0036072E83